jgi:hypothetical protein
MTAGVINASDAFAVVVIVAALVVIAACLVVIAAVLVVIFATIVASRIFAAVLLQLL